MLTVKECRKVLGEKFKDCTDEQILSIRDWLMELAKINEEVIEQNQSMESED